MPMGLKEKIAASSATGMASTPSREEAERMWYHHRPGNKPEDFQEKESLDLIEGGYQTGEMNGIA